MSKLKEYKILDSLPKGWIYLNNQTILNGISYEWVSNGKSRFGGEYEHALIKRGD
jgi:hypothetical protein